MKPDLRNFLIKICLWIAVLSTAFFWIIFEIFKFTNVSQAFKESLSVSVGFLSALATIGAAIIAARLFQTWKTQHSYVEQIRILSQMVETIDEILSNLEAARQNENLERIILQLPYDLSLNDSFLEQKRQTKILENSINKLYKLENLIYLLNNNTVDNPVFTEDQEGTCPLTSLSNYAHILNKDISTINEYLFDDIENGYFSFTKFNVSEIKIQNMILNILKDGDSTLRMAAPDCFTLKENPTNIVLTKWIVGLHQRIMKYRDSLNTLN
ncbi:hypothetical protein NQ788_06370 [Acinetobacter baumannii]|nr:hypothetical protein [Acinetobacter baumannii]